MHIACKPILGKAIEYARPGRLALHMHALYAICMEAELHFILLTWLEIYIKLNRMQ